MPTTEKPAIVELIEFTIDRQTWYRGQGEDGSRLIRVEDEHKCCLGFFGCHLTVSESGMTGVGTPANMLNWSIPAPSAAHPFVKAGICVKATGNSRYDWQSSGTSKRIIVVNDDPLIDETRREKELTGLFAELGYKPVFIN